MSAAVRIDVPTSIAGAWRQAPEIVEEELLRAVLEGELLLQREVVERAPAGVGGGGGLRGSIQADTPTIGANTVEGTVGTPLVYAPAMELGTKPHKPPVAPLIPWVKQVLGLADKEAERAAEAISWKIARHGTQGAFMFQKALDANRQQLARILEAAGPRILARLAGAA